MEFGLHERLPIYSGGLGVLAGDHLKAAAELGVPLVGVGLLYRGGYFRQEIDADGRQTEDYQRVDPNAVVGSVSLRAGAAERAGATGILGSCSPAVEPAPPTPRVPRGTLFFVHGANETSDGSRPQRHPHPGPGPRNAAGTSRVVAPGWRRRSGLRLGDWPKALVPRTARRADCRSRSSAPASARRRSPSSSRTITRTGGSRCSSQIGAQLLADVIGYHRHRASIHAALREELERAAEQAAADGSTRSCRSRSALAGSRLSTCSRRLARGAGRGVRHGRLAGAAALHVRRPRRAALRRDRTRRAWRFRG